MNDKALLDRIEVDSKVMMGKPVIKGTRLTVEFIVNLLAHGASIKNVVEEYDGITAEDIQACLLFAGESLSRVEFMPLTAETGDAIPR